MARTFTHSFVRTQFLKAELTGLAAGTANNSTFIKAIGYGVDNACINEIEVNLNDGTHKKAVLKIKVDWEKHQAYLKEDSGNFSGLGTQAEGEVTGHVFQQIIALLNEFKVAKGLSFWWNISWLSDGAKHDQACGISRVSADEKGGLHPLPPSATGRSLFHERLPEVNISLSIDDR